MLSRKDGESSNLISRKARGLMFRSMSPLSASRSRRMKRLDDEEAQTESEAEAEAEDASARRLLMDNVGKNASNRDVKNSSSSNGQGNVIANSSSNNRVVGATNEPNISSRETNSTSGSVFSFSASSRGRRSDKAAAPDASDSDSVSSQSTSSSSSSTKRPGLLARARSRSRSSSRSRDRNQESKQVVVAVTSCRSDAYYHQKAPGSTAMLPRKAPSALKLFHELAVGVKDAYAALGATPTKPDMDDNGKLIIGQDQTRVEAEGMKVLWEFMGNLDFVSYSKCIFKWSWS